MQDINLIHSFLIGLCCARDAIRQQIHENWEKRFSPHTSLLVDVDDGDDVISIVKKAQRKLIEQKIIVGAGKGCVLAIFCDLTTQINGVLLDTMDKSISMLSHALQCNMEATIQYAYVGQVSLLEERESVRSHITAMVERNIKQPKRTQLVLVATPFLQAEGYELWKAPLLLLDLLRRNSNPLDVLPATPDGMDNNDIGFLSYAEHDSVMREKLSTEVRNLMRLVSSEGSERLAHAKQQLLQRKKREIIEAYPINGGLQPQHPGMNVSDGGFLRNNRARAARGTLETFNDAQRQTDNAVLSTAIAMHEEIVESYKSMASDADKIIEQLQKDSGTGIPILQDSNRMLELLTFTDTTVRRPNQLSLTYSPTGYISQIGIYLEQYRDYAIYCGGALLCEAIREAYAKIPRYTYEEKLDRFRHELSEKQQRLDATCEPDEFFESAYFNSLMLSAEFFAPPTGSINRTYITVRGAKCRDFEAMEKGFAGNTRSYYVSDTGSGIPQPDNAPIKALRLTLLDCSKSNLLSLIPEV